MAWRDSRTSRPRLLLFSCSIVMGIGALAAIGSLGTNLERAIGERPVPEVIAEVDELWTSRGLRAGWHVCCTGSRCRSG